MKIVINRSTRAFPHEALIRLIERNASIVFSVPLEEWGVKYYGSMDPVPLRDGFVVHPCLDGQVMRGGKAYGIEYDATRDDPDLVAVIEGMREDASFKLEGWIVVTIPDDVDWYIYESHLGPESIHEIHRVWCGSMYDPQS